MAEPNVSDAQDRLRRTEEILGYVLERIAAIDPAGGASVRTYADSLSSPPLLGMSRPNVDYRFSNSPEWSLSGTHLVGGASTNLRLSALEELVAQLSAENREIKRINASLELRLTGVEGSQARFAREFTLLLVQLSRAPQLDKLKFHRGIPIAIYLSETNPAQGQALHRDILRLLERHGFGSLAEASEIYSSWFKRAFAATKEVANSEQVQSRLARVEEAVELKHIDLIKSERDKNHSEAVLNLSKALEGQPKAVIIIGSLLYIKLPHRDGPQVFSRTLTRQQQDLLEEQPELQLDPERLYEAFFAVKRDQPAVVTHASKPKTITRKLDLGDG